MNRCIVALSLALALSVGCGDSAAVGGGDPPVELELDAAAPDAPDAHVAELAPDAGTADTAAPAIDAGDAGHVDATDAAPVPDAPDARQVVPVPDAAPVPDAGTPAEDAAPDAPPAVKDCTTGPECACGAPTSVAALTKEINAVRSVFTAACVNGSAGTMCGGVRVDGVPLTLPLQCSQLTGMPGTWVLAGSWSSCQWSAWHDCSHGCAEGKLCAP